MNQQSRAKLTIFLSILPLSFGACGGSSESSRAEAVDGSIVAIPEKKPEADGGLRPEPSGAVEGIELVNGQVGPEFVAVDDNFVYWSNFEDDRVMKIAKDGDASPVEIYRNDRITNKSIAVDGTSIYWGGLSLHKQDKDTGAVALFDFGIPPANSTLIYNVVTTGERVFWGFDFSGGIQLKSMNSDGSDVRLHGARQNKSFSFTIADGNAYIAQFSPDEDDGGNIEILSLAGGPPKFFCATKFVYSMVVDEQYVYWLEGRVRGAIKRKPKMGSEEAVTLSAGVEILGPQAMAASEGTLFWTELGFAGGEGGVGSVSKTGGDAHLIAKHQVVPQAIAADHKFVYWVNYGPTANGTVRKIAR